MSKLRRVGDWLEERTGWGAVARAWIDRPALGAAPYSAVIAASVAACVGVLAFTGCLLMTAYGASPQAAWASVHYVQFVQDRGWLVRGLHYWAAQSLIVLAALHVMHGAFVGIYVKPREVAWWLTLGVLGLTLAEAITGGMLPWDERGWWARVVEGNIVGLAPGIGEWLREMILGGSDLGALGLARGYAMHVAVLPALLGVVLLARRAIVSRFGWVAAGWTAAGTPTAAGLPAAAPFEQASPRRVWRSVLAMAAVVALVFVLATAAHGAPLDAPADPMGDYPARPEWFLLPMYALRKAMHVLGDFLGTSLPPLFAAGYLVFLPWIDKPGRPRAALVYAPVLLIFGGAVALGAMAVRNDARDAQYAKQRAKAELRAAAAATIAMGGVPPEGALAMMRADPEMHGRDLFEQHCASCHVLAGLGDPQKATATKLDGWTTAQWIEAMMHDPDGPEFFGRGPYKGKMPSVDVRPKDKPPGESWSPMIRTPTDRANVAAFLAAQGAEPGDPPLPGDAALREAGEKIVADRCTSCHLYKGDGDLNDSEVAPELAHYGSVSWTRSQVANPATPQTYRENALSETLKKHMPRFDKDLSPADIDTVTRWTRAHARGIPLR
jgi:ubiquinol-cytochrome c reductase cytochrome b subunit